MGRAALAQRLAGGDATAGALLEAAIAGPTAENLAALANAINDAMEPAESAGLRLRIFGEAARIRRESKDDTVRGWALAVLQNALWAGLYWRFGYMQGKNFSEDSDRAAPMPWGAIPETERDYFLGAWPDPEAQGRALGEDLAAGRLRVDERWKGPATGRGGAESIELWMGRAPIKDPGLDVNGRREGEAVVLAVANRRKTPLAVNTLAPKYAVALQGWRAGRWDRQDRLRQSGFHAGRPSLS